jgi:hypothetical protein
LDGTLTLKPGLPGAAQPVSTKPISAKVHNATGSDCAGSVTGGKAPINGAVVQFNAKVGPGQSCSTLNTTGVGFSKPVLIIKLTNTTAGKTKAVAVVKPTNLHFSVLLAPLKVGLDITGTIPQTKANNKPFGGEMFEAAVYIDNVLDAVACAEPPAMTPLDHIDFSSAGGSGFTIHP